MRRIQRDCIWKKGKQKKTGNKKETGNRRKDGSEDQQRRKPGKRQIISQGGDTPGDGKAVFRVFLFSVFFLFCDYFRQSATVCFISDLLMTSL